MSKRQRKTPPKARDKPTSACMAWLCGADAFDTLTCQGYTSLAQNPEIIAGVDAIARAIGSMSIHLLRNSTDGDLRVFDGLARKLDIDPNANMTRSAFMAWIVRTMYLEGNGNAVVWPQTENGRLRDLIPIPPAYASFVPDGWGYRVYINGQAHRPDEVLHFTSGPTPSIPGWAPATGYPWARWPTT